VAGVSAGRVRDALWAAGVAVTVSPAASTPLDMGRRGLAELVRASPHYFVAPDQLDTCVAEVARLAR
jgi:selenocysteine lyase/cysteine desulfurase